jgi:hypothetical protein
MEDESYFSNGIPYPNFFGDKDAYVPYTWEDWDIWMLFFGYLSYEIQFPVWILFTFY